MFDVIGPDDKEKMEKLRAMMLPQADNGITDHQLTFNEPLAG